jgi:hypothetical protein
MTTRLVDLTIIILTYNAKTWLELTLTSLKKNYLDHARRRIKVVVVDNKSTDGTDQLMQAFTWATYLPQPTNAGYAAGNNRALERTQSPYVMLFNSDVESTTYSNLDILLDYMDAHPNVGVITPRVELPNGSIDPASHRGEPTLWASFCYFAKLEKLFPTTQLFGGYHQYYKNLQEIHEIDACSGAAMIVRQDVINQVGLLDEQFFMYAEDLDWCKRIREAGYSVVYHPEVTVIHHKYKSGLGSSSKTTVSKTRDHFYTTMIQYFDKHYANQYPKWVRASINYLLTLKKGVS